MWLHKAAEASVQRGRKLSILFDFDLEKYSQWVVVLKRLHFSTSAVHLAPPSGPRPNQKGHRSCTGRQCCWDYRLRHQSASLLFWYVFQTFRG